MNSKRHAQTCTESQKHCGWNDTHLREQHTHPHTRTHTCIMMVSLKFTCSFANALHTRWWELVSERRAAVSHLSVRPWGLTPRPCAGNCAIHSSIHPIPYFPHSIRVWTTTNTQTQQMPSHTACVAVSECIRCAAVGVWNQESQTSSSRLTWC